MDTRHGKEPPTDQGSAPRLLRGRILRGCNIHHGATVFLQPMDPGALFGLRSRDIGEDFTARFIERFGSLESCSRGGCLLEATRSALESEPGLPLTETLLEAILAVERYVAWAMCRLDTPQFSLVVQSHGVIELVWESHSAGISRAAARAAFAGLLELLPAGLGGQISPPQNFETLLAKLGRRGRRRQWSATTAVLVRAAKQRGLAHELLAGNYLRIGEGVLQQVVSEAALGISPSPEHGPELVESSGDSPSRIEQGRLHYLLVVDSHLLSALRCDPPSIIGDGTSSIGQLIDRLKNGTRRNDVALHKLVLDERLQSDLAALGFGLDHVPPRGEQFVLPGIMSVERGALPIDVTGQVHDSVRKAAIGAAEEQDRAIVRVEFLTADITRSFGHGRGRVVGTSGPPGLFLHASLGGGHTCAVGKAVLHRVFPEGAADRIPTVLIVGERGARSIAVGLDRLLRTSYKGVGLATFDRTTIQGRPIDPTSVDRRGGPAYLLGDPRVDIVVCSVSPRKIVRRGLQLERSSVTALLDPALDTDFKTYRASVNVSLKATTSTVVIGVDNPHTEFILDSLEPARVLLIARSRQHPLALRHTAAGGSLVVSSPRRRKGFIELRRGRKKIASIPISTLRSIAVGLGGRGPLTSLYRAGLAFALGVPAVQARARKPKRVAERNERGQEPVIVPMTKVDAEGVHGSIQSP